MPTRQLLSRPGAQAGQSIGALHLARFLLQRGIAPPALSPTDAVDQVLQAGIAGWLRHSAFNVRDWLTLEVATSMAARDLTSYGQWKDACGWSSEPAEDGSIAIMLGASCGQNYLDVRELGELLQRLHPRGADLLLSTLNAVDELLYPVLTPWQLFDMASSVLWFGASDDEGYLQESDPDLGDEVAAEIRSSPRAILDYLGWEGPSTFVEQHPTWALPPDSRHKLLAQDPRQRSLLPRSKQRPNDDAVLDRCLSAAAATPLRAMLERLGALCAALQSRRRRKHRVKVTTYWPEEGFFVQACSNRSMQFWIDNVYQHQLEGEGVTPYFGEICVPIRGTQDARCLQRMLRDYVEDLATLAAFVDALQPLMKEEKDID